MEYISRGIEEKIGYIGLASVNTFMALNNYGFILSNHKEIMEKILEDINYNLTIYLKQTLEKFMSDFCKIYFAEGKMLQPSPIGVYNDFNHTRIHHRHDLDFLKKEIREYLHIDEKW